MKYAAIFTFGLICSVVAAKLVQVSGSEAKSSRIVPIWPQHPSNRFRSVPLRLVQGGSHHE